MGVGQLEQLHSSTHQSLEKQKGLLLAWGWPPACGGSRPCWEQRGKTGQSSWGGADLGHLRPLSISAVPGSPNCTNLDFLSAAGISAEGLSHRAAGESCTWIPEVLGKPVQTWVVRSKHGADFSNPPGPDQTTQSSRVNHFQVWGSGACGRPREPTWREWTGRQACPTWLPGSSSPVEAKEARGQGSGRGGQRG